MRLFKEELRKIVSRKLVWGSIVLLMILVTVWVMAAVAKEEVTIDGKTYTGREAIKKDKELTKEYAGPLTLEKMNDIYERFGFYHFDSETGNRIGNFCNYFITMHMTNFNEVGGEDVEQIHFYEGTEWKDNAAPFFENETRLTYARGWQLMQDNTMVLGVYLQLIIIIALCPVFSEEYSLGTADLLLTTEHGKKKGIWIKILAAMVFAALLCILFALFYFTVFAAAFGMEGLSGSSQLVGSLFGGITTETIGGFFLLELGLSLAGMAFLAGITVFVSANSKSSFLTVIVSLLLFAVPVIWVRVLAPTWILGVAGTKVMNHIMVSMPVYLQWNWGFYFSEKQLAVHLLLASALGTAAVWCAYRRYRNYQGRS